MSGSETPGAFVSVELDAGAETAAATLAARLSGLEVAQLLLFASPDAPLPRLLRDVAAALPGVAVAGCTTAGEIGAGGYAAGTILAVALPARRFAARTVVVEGLAALDAAAVGRRVLAARRALAAEHPGRANAFAFLMVDGLSLREDELAAALAPALAGVPLFGGSAGDGTRFRATWVAEGRRAMRDAAVLTLVATDLRAQVFSLDHLRPTARRMVVTGADPARRIVKEINAEPAAREYARICGIDPDGLDEFTFASHPVAVRLGEHHHVRAIQRVNEAGELVFFSAIDEGMVLAVAEPEPMAAHLDGALARLAGGRRPAGILACDCILRRIEAERTQASGAVSAVLARHGVRGFSTYGEQYGPMHVNQTMTGVMLFDPEAGP